MRKRIISTLFVHLIQAQKRGDEVESRARRDELRAVLLGCEDCEGHKTLQVFIEDGGDGEFPEVCHKCEETGRRDLHKPHAQPGFWFLRETILVCPLLVHGDF